MNLKIRLQLSAMMFLTFFIWSVWYVAMGPYLREVLKFTPSQIGWAYNATGLAAIVSPFFVGMIADRFFATQKILATLHLAGAVLMFAVSRSKSFVVFYPLLIGYTLCFMPTLALANTLALKQMKDPGKEFSRVAVLGTIGWITAGQVLGLFGAKATATPISFQLGAAVSLLMGLYALTLPHTPPQAKGQPATTRDVLGLDALRLLRDRSFAVFVIAAFLFCIPLTLYFGFAAQYLEDFGVPSVVRAMTYGQMSEIVAMLVMPFFLVWLGIKWVFVVGMAAWALRYFLFYAGYGGDTLWPHYSGVAIHGVCYVFFFVLAYVYVDKKAPEAIRTKAQGFIALVTLGLGFFVGSNVSGLVVQHYSAPNAEPTRYRVVQAGEFAAGDVVKWQANNVPTFGKITTIAKQGDDPSKATAAVQVWKRTDRAYQATAETATVPLSALAKPVTLSRAEKDAFLGRGATVLYRPMTLWDKVWGLASGAGVVIMVLFVLLFRHKEEPKPAPAA
jgi:nucleoside transporter